MPVSHSFSGVETCARLSRASDPSGSDDDGRSRGSLLKAQASARVDLPTVHQFFQYGPRSLTRVKLLRESQDMCSTDN